MLDQLADAVIGVDPHCVIEVANPAAARLTGYSVDDLVGRPCHVLRPRAKDGRPLADDG